MKLRHDPNPAERPAATEIAFTTDAGIRFTVIGSTDRGDRVRKVPAHLDVLVQDMIPLPFNQQDEAPLGVSRFDDRGRLGDPPRLGAQVDGTVATRCRVRRQRGMRVADDQPPWDCSRRAATELPAGEHDELPRVIDPPGCASASDSQPQARMSTGGIHG